MREIAGNPLLLMLMAISAGVTRCPATGVGSTRT